MDPADLRPDLRNEAHALAARLAMAPDKAAKAAAREAIGAAGRRLGKLEGAPVRTAFVRETMDAYAGMAAAPNWERRFVRWINRRFYATDPKVDAKARAGAEMMKGALEERLGLACAVQREREPIPAGWQTVGGCGPYRLIAERDLLTAMRETRERERP